MGILSGSSGRASGRLGTALYELVPKLQLGNPEAEAPASRDWKLELPSLHSQAGVWERVNIFQGFTFALVFKVGIITLRYFKRSQIAPRCPNEQAIGLTACWFDNSRVGRATALSLPDNHAEIVGRKKTRSTYVTVDRRDALYRV